MITQYIGEATILGVASLNFHPLLQSFVKAFIPVTQGQYVISDRMKEHVLRPTEPGDPTAIVSEYKSDWWNVGAGGTMESLYVFEVAYDFHLLTACIFQFVLSAAGDY